MRIFCSSALLALLAFSPSMLLADCTAPAAPGVRICSPTANSTLTYPPYIDFQSTPTAGAQITKFIMYDNNKSFFEDDGGDTGVVWGDGDAFNGTHRVVINAWDSTGKLYQSSVSFKVTGDGFPAFCPTPASPGVNFCTPQEGAVLGVTYPVSAAVKGKSAIANIRLYVDGKEQFTSITAGNKVSTNVTVSKQGNHSVTFSAWDTQGNLFKSSRTIPSTYTYGWSECPPRDDIPCTPGFDDEFSTIPLFNSYVDNTFPIMAKITQNPHTVTVMKAYLDNTLVATSNGPTMASTVENAPSGTHILTLQAWDTTGVMYRVHYNINVNVPH